ncbi:MAG TPA: hypothetical protein VGH81_02050 [Rudaea sp.]
MCCAAVLGVVCAIASAGTPVGDASRTPPAASVKVSGEDGKSQDFEVAALARLPQHNVHAEAHGKAVDCSGPNVIDLLGAVGAPNGEALRGKGLALYVRVSAADGYRAVFALAELDPVFRSDVPIVAASCDGKALDPKDGPFRLVIPGEKRPARWVRQVTAVDLLRAP